jgi:tRNA(Arg) A34 adenosine deaminase TadA
MIPSEQPSTNEQIEFCRKIWNIQISPSVYKKYLYEHSKKEIEIIKKIVYEIKELRYFLIKDNDNDNDYNRDNDNNNIIKISCLIYDKNQDKIIVKIKEDKENKNENNCNNISINHPVMKCINEFCFQLTDEYVHDNMLNDKSLIPKINNKNYIDIDNDNDNEIDTGNLLEIKNESLYNYNDQYYCQGLYMFIFNEPCFMCAMALVHSRIERVYFFKDNLIDGAFHTKLKILNYNLNHNYLIFQINN